MATYYNHAQIGIVDSSGNVNVIYPKTTADDVTVTPNSNYSAGNTVQKVISKLGSAAFLDNFSLGGTNLISRYHIDQMQIYENIHVEKNRSDCPHGFYMVGQQSGGGTIRIPHVIDSNGIYTVSLEVRGSQNVSVGFTIDLCDGKKYVIKTSTDNKWNKYSFNIDVTSYGGIYDFLDFSDIDWAYIFIKNIKIERGSYATDWNLSPGDVTMTGPIDYRYGGGYIKSMEIVHDHSVNKPRLRINSTNNKFFLLDVWYSG